MKHYYVVIFIIAILFCNCEDQGKKQNSVNLEHTYSIEDEIGDESGYFEDFPQDNLTEYPEEFDEEDEDDFVEVIEEEPNPFKDIIPDDSFIVQIDTLPFHKIYAIQELIESATPRGIVARYIYPKEARNSLLERGNQYRKFTGGSTNIFSCWDWNTSDEPFIIRNNIGTYLINPHKKPIYGFVIATMNSAPVFYEGVDLDGEALLKTYFNITTKQELKEIASENGEEMKKWLSNHHEKQFKEHFPESTHNLNSNQIKILNKYIFDYQLKFKNLFALPTRPDIDSFKGKVKRVNYKYQSAGTIMDTTYISLEFDKKNKLVMYTEYTKTRAAYKTIYTFGYTQDGLLKDVFNINGTIKYKVYAYNDRIILAEYPSPYDNETRILETRTMYLSEEGLPLEIEIRYKEKKIMPGNSIFRFDKNKNLIYYDTGFENHIYNPKNYEYEGNKLKKVIMKQYVDNDFHDLVYEYDKDKVIMRSKNATYIQTLTYDKKGNILSAVFDGRAGIFETTSYFYEYEYY